MIRLNTHVYFVYTTFATNLQNMPNTTLAEILREHQPKFNTIVPFNLAQDKLLRFDFTASNKTLSPETVQDTKAFTQYIEAELINENCTYGIGGYDENRTLYARSAVFDGAEPRRLHLGIDIWGSLGTPIYAPLDGVVHSFAFNDAFGDYGATIILKHELEGHTFHTLYGHLALNAIRYLSMGDVISQGSRIAFFGNAEENGHWPPHLHFQSIIDMQGMEGDYPGVCALSQRENYLANCPDPDLLLGMMQFAIDKKEQFA